MFPKRICRFMGPLFGGTPSKSDVPVKTRKIPVRHVPEKIVNVPVLFGSCEPGHPVKCPDQPGHFDHVPVKRVKSC